MRGSISTAAVIAALALSAVQPAAAAAPDNTLLIGTLYSGTGTNGSTGYSCYANDNIGEFSVYKRKGSGPVSIGLESITLQPPGPVNALRIGGVFKLNFSTATSGDVTIPKAPDSKNFAGATFDSYAQTWLAGKGILTVTFKLNLTGCDPFTVSATYQP